MATDPYKYFRLEARELLDQLGKGILELERGGGADLVQRLLRHAHTLKGAARVVRQAEIADHAHAIEGALAPLRDGTTAATRDQVTAVLALLDGITQRLDRLPAGDRLAASPSLSVTPAPEPAAMVADDSPASHEAPGEIRTVRADLAEMDELLDAVMEAHTRIGTLRASVELAGDARELADLVVAQLAPRDSLEGTRTVARDRVHALANQLRDRVRHLELSLGVGIEHVERELVQVRDVAEHLRLVPAHALFTFVERTVRDAAHAVGKQVMFEGTGGDIRLDAHVLRSIQSALLQLARNAVAHGIEPQIERVAAGKLPVGRVSVAVARRGRRIAFICRDDGAGIDLEGVRRAALRRGMSTAATERLDAQQLILLLLQGGLSTAAAVTEVAGRGIGLDVVREVVDRLGGEVTVTSERGRGTTFELVVPLSLASVETLAVEAEGVAAIIPLDAIVRTMRLAAGEVARSAAGETIVSDGKVIPFVPLARALRLGDSKPHRAWSTVIVAGAAGTAAVGVDRMRGTSTVVVRPIAEIAGAAATVAGAALDAEGNPQLVLDPDGLVAEARRALDMARSPRVDPHAILVIDDSLTTRMLEQSILESAGYSVDTATSGEQALETARGRHYALFLVDVEMPGIDGFTFIERARADPALRDTPAILVTSRSSPDDRRRGEAVGANGYIIKSEFDQVELLAQIQRLIG